MSRNFPSLGAPITDPIVREISRARAGRPSVVGDYVVMLAGAEGTITLKISTAAPMFVEYMDFVMDDQPILNPAAVAVPIDIRSLRLQREEMSSEEEIIIGQFNLMCLMGGSGAQGSQYLSKGDIVHQGSTMTFILVNRGVAQHRVDIAVHGFLLTREQLQEYLGR